MALKVKSAADSGEKLVQRAQAAAGEYSVRAQAAASDWQTNAQLAKGNYQQAITQGNIAERFARGIAKAGSAKYSGKIMRLGATRFSPGVADGKGDYIANVEPYFGVIASLTLTPRQPRGSAANYQRSQQVGDKLNAKRLALLGTGAG